MKKIPASEIKSGMVLAKPVRGPSGNILLNAGATLQAGMANRLQSWGIPLVFVEGDDEDGGSNGSIKKMPPEEIEKVLMDRFGDTKNDVVMNMIFRCTRDHFLKKGTV